VKPRRQQLCRVITDYRSAYPDPIAFNPGDRLVVEDRVSEWPGWIWCTTPNGKSGWAPASHIQRSGENGMAMRSYYATELSVAQGEELTILGEESGWYWCADPRGLKGWVPAENVTLIK
jgi:hypothetical protein